MRVAQAAQEGDVWKGCWELFQLMRDDEREIRDLVRQPGWTESILLSGLVRLWMATDKVRSAVPAVHRADRAAAVSSGSQAAAPRLCLHAARDHNCVLTMLGTR